jgi:hypothetical protein
LKGPVVLILTFIAVFVGITALVLIGVDKYENIFTLDFRPKVHANKLIAVNDSSENDNMVDSVLVLNNSVDSKIAVDSSGNIKSPGSSITQKISENNNNPKISLIDSVSISKNIKTNDSAYTKWKKSTVKLYEAMDSKRAAKIIQTFSDNVARDLIYSMKKKKAAEILSIMPPEIASRITRQE